MKNPFSLFLSAILVAGVAPAKAQDKPDIPREVRKALGGMGAVQAYIAQVALGELHKVDESKADVLAAALTSISGVQGGVANTARVLTNCLPFLEEAEATSVQEIIRANTLMEDQAKALVALLRAKSNGSGVEAAQTEVEEIRKACAAALVDFGFDEDLVK